MCLRAFDKSVGPSTEPARSLAKADTDPPPPRAKASSASRTTADRVDFLVLASLETALSSFSGNLNDTVRIGSAIVLPRCQKRITQPRAGQFDPPLARRARASA